MSHRELRRLKINYLPSNLKEAMLFFEKSPLMKKSIGDDIFNKLIEAKTSRMG